MLFPLFDSHCHLSLLTREGGGVVPFYQSLVEKGSLLFAWDIGINAVDYPTRRALLGDCSWVYYAIGLHPNETHKQTIDFDQWAKWAQEDRVIMIGETGLDFFRGAEFEQAQRKSFIEQIEFANLVKKPIVVHVRHAEEVLLQVLKEHPPLWGGIWHCFSADYATASKAVDRGFMISFAGNLTYKKTEMMAEAAARLPVESLLIETDAPYLTPVPFRGKPNHSGYLIYTLDRLAEIRQKNPQELAYQIAENGKALLRDAR